MVRFLLLSSVLVLLTGCFATTAEQQVPHAELPIDIEAGWNNPPVEARPRTWYHVMSGNMTAAGITKDLEAMRTAGLGGLLLFNITQGIPNGPVVYDSPEHHALLRHAAAEAERLGLSFGVHNCDGWSSSGGPWVTPELSMKMVVWTDTVVAGGKLDIQLPHPTTREGYYRELATVAYPSLTGERVDAAQQPVVSSSDPGFEAAVVLRGRWDDQTSLSKAVDYVQFAYPQPVTIRSARAIFNNRHSELCLELSSDGVSFQPAHLRDDGSPRPIHKVRNGKHEWAVNEVYPDGLTARYFRVVASGPTQLLQLELSSHRPLNDLLSRSAIARKPADQLGAIGEPSAGSIVQRERLVDLSEDLGPDGRLTTELPSDGPYTILRFGITATGARNHPASAEGRGLEVDKLSREAFKVHYDAFVGQVNDNVGPVAPNALQYAEIDSYEMGGQNWTTGFSESFAAAKGYDLMAYLPLLAGRFVDDASTSEAVLADFRDHIGNLFRDNYFAYFTELCHEDGILSYIEPYGFGPFNDLAVGATADLPMGEFWMNRPPTRIESAVSSAHIYGKPIISAESFTSRPEINWTGHPAMAKASGDQAWTMGINEFMYHRFVHQANTHVLPGMTMNRWGFHMDGTQTWWTTAGRAWFAYVARGSYLLRQGQPVADLLVFAGDGTPTATFSRDQLTPAVPTWVKLDNINAEVLAEAHISQPNKPTNGFTSATSPQVVLPFSDGRTSHAYRALFLPETGPIALATAQQLAALARAGFPLYGTVPELLLGHGHSKEDRAAFAKTCAVLAEAVQPVSSWEAVYKTRGWVPDVRVEGRDDMEFAHRHVSGQDVYFLYNPDSLAQEFVVSFRQNQPRAPEFWDPVTGNISPLEQYAHTAGATRVRIPLSAAQAGFVVFRSPDETGGGRNPETPSRKQETVVAEPTGPWQVAFPQLSGDTTTATFAQLRDWSLAKDEAIRFFSGTGHYTTTIEIPAQAQGERFTLDLGQVANSAEVYVNGDSVGVAWMPPFHLDVTDAVRAGTNDLEIRVTNAWTNRLIGDERYPPHFDGYQLTRHRNGNGTADRMPAWYAENRPVPEGPRQTFTTADFFEADSPLETSGLLGPVRLLQHPPSR